MKIDKQIVIRRKNTLNHLNRIQGQIYTLKKLIEGDYSCFDIAQLTTSIAKSFDSLRTRTFEGFILGHLLSGKNLPSGKLNDLKKITNLYKK